MTTNAASTHLQQSSERCGWRWHNVEVECGGRHENLLTIVMHVPRPKEKSLFKSPSTNRLRESHPSRPMSYLKRQPTYAEAMLGGELYEVKMKVLLPENIMSAVRRDGPAVTYTLAPETRHCATPWLKKLAIQELFKGMEVTNTQLPAYAEAASWADGWKTIWGTVRARLSSVRILQPTS